MHMMKSDDPSTRHYWQAASKLYAIEGVESLCLDLQNRLNCDINIVLMLAIFESSCLTPTDDCLAELHNNASEWCEEVLGLVRTNRLAYKSSKEKDELYNILKGLELLMEQEAHAELVERISLVPISAKMPSKIEQYISSNSNGVKVPDLTVLRHAAKEITASA